MHAHAEQRIACPPEKAFDLMADARNETEWNSQVSRSELVGDGPIGLGTRFVTVNRGRPYDATISTYERPGRLGFAVSGTQMDIGASFEFAADGDGTRYRAEFDFRPKGALTLFMPLMGAMVRRDVAKQSASFKALCERGG